VRGEKVRSFTLSPFAYSSGVRLCSENRGVVVAPSRRRRDEKEQLTVILFIIS